MFFFQQFTAESTLRHGFPFKPLSVAFDPIQKVLAIGNRQGGVRIYGKPGIDVEFSHENPCQVMQIIFVVNTGKLLTACTDDSINLWDFSKKVPELEQTLKLGRERLTRIHLEFQVGVKKSIATLLKQFHFKSTKLRTLNRYEQEDLTYMRDFGMGIVTGTPSILNQI